MNHGFVKFFAGALGAIALVAVSPVYADGTTQRELTMSRYKNCEWTDVMGKEIYECIARNNGFNAHWCHHETIQAHCEPEPIAAANKDRGVSHK